MTNNEIKMRMNANGQLADSTNELCEFRCWTSGERNADSTNELCEFRCWTSGERNKAREIRMGCAEAIKVILDGYNPLHGLPNLEAPKKEDPVELIRFAQFAALDGFTADDAVKVIAKAEKEYSDKLNDYKRELRHRRRILNHYEYIYSDMIKMIKNGHYKDALRRARDELKGSYRHEVSSVIIKALSQEAPLSSRAEERHSKHVKKWDAEKKIEEGVRALLNLR